MNPPFLITSSSMAVPTSLKTLSILLDLTERRVQQLAREGVMVRDKRGRYDLIPSIQGYVRYLRAYAEKKHVDVEEELAKLASMDLSDLDELLSRPC